MVGKATLWLLYGIAVAHGDGSVLKSYPYPPADAFGPPSKVYGVPVLIENCEEHKPVVEVSGPQPGYVVIDVNSNREKEYASFATVVAPPPAPELPLRVSTNINEVDNELSKHLDEDGHKKIHKIPAAPELPPFLSHFVAQGVYGSLKPQFIHPSTIIPNAIPVRIADKESTKILSSIHFPLLPCEIIAETPVAVSIPAPPELPPRLSPQLPAVVHVEQQDIVEQDFIPEAPELPPARISEIAFPIIVQPDEIEAPLVPNEVLEVITIPQPPELPPFKPPVIPPQVVVKEPCDYPPVSVPQNHEHIVDYEVLRPVDIPQPPKLPQFVLPKIPSPVIIENPIEIPVLEPIVIPRAPELPPLALPETPSQIIVEENINTYPYPPPSILENPIVIPHPPKLPLVALPKKEEGKGKIPSPINVVENHIETIVVPQPPELPPFVFPEIPSRVIVETPIEVHVPNPPVQIADEPIEPIIIPQPPELPPFVVPEIPSQVIVETPVEVIPVPCPPAQIANKPIETIVIPQPPELPPFVVPEIPSQVIVETPVEVIPVPCPPAHIANEPIETIVIPQPPELPPLVISEIPSPILIEKPVEYPYPAPVAVIEPVPIPQPPKLPPIINAQISFENPIPVEVIRPVPIPQPPELPTIVLPEIPSHDEEDDGFLSHDDTHVNKPVTVIVQGPPKLPDCLHTDIPYIVKERILDRVFYPVISNCRTCVTKDSIGNNE